MASNTDQTLAFQEENEFCTVEASVVTGFEESARGEAIEKFNTDVRAARGKITWKVPLNKLKDVLTMGSVDNCKVVIHTVPYFHFTDQHDSLARLQKMVKDIDWGSGLKAWQRIYNFPYPIATQPDNILSADDLVDVVITTHQPPSKDKSVKKSKKKGGWGKKKQKKKDEVGLNKENVSCETGVGIPADSQSRADHENKETDIGDTAETCPKSPVNEKGDSDAQHLSEVLTSNEEDIGLSEVNITTVPNVADGKTKTKLQVRIDGQPLPDTDASDAVSKIPQPVRDPGEVICNQVGLKENEFIMSDVGCKAQDTDEHTSRPKDENQYLESGADMKLEVDKSEEIIVKTSELTFDSNSSPVKESQLSADSSLSLASRKISESEFASIVIRRLSSPAQAASKGDALGSDSPKMSCVTPPPTPIRSIDNPFSNLILQDRFHAELLPFRDSAMRFPDGDSNIPGAHRDDIGSSVDPSLSKTQAEDILLSKNTAPSNFSTVPLVSSENAEESSGIEVSPGQPLSPRQQTVHEECPLEGRNSTLDGTTPVKKERDPTKPTFRVTCNRTGDSHAFDSSSAAASFGSAIITYLNWQVDLKNFDIEVILNIDNEEVTVSLALTKMSLHYRNLVAFGPTTLRATICCNMLRLCRIKNGDFVCDPMCGTCAIPIEGALNWVNCYHFGGDMHEKAIEKTSLNITAIQERMKAGNESSLKLDAVRWDVQHLPLRDKCVDVFVSDLPFGYRIGSKYENRALYSSLLSEMARTARSGARACLLTEDKANLIRAIQTFGKYWQRRLILNINIGGLTAFVFLLTRTTTTMAESWSSWRGGDCRTADGSSSGESVTPTTDETVLSPVKDANTKYMTE